MQVTIPITIDNLPKGPRWEADGACWTAILDSSEPDGWRWRPNNWKAFGKENPQGEMTDIITIQLLPNPPEEV